MSALDTSPDNRSQLGPAVAFPADYAQGRARFLDAAHAAGAKVEHHVLEGLLGLQGEELALDVALLPSLNHSEGSEAAASCPLLIVSSGVHGVEGLCGSGCQHHLLSDPEMLSLARAKQIDLLFLHAVNPHGFSYLRRGNEDNIDLNRNCLDFDKNGATLNPEYASLHPLLIPTTWPPSEEVQQALNDLIQQMGTAAFKRAATAGQSSHSNGLFYSGKAPSWSNLTVRKILRQHGSQRSQIAWIDLHTGLGPRGHGEKIHAGRTVEDDLLRGRRLWGADVVAAWEGASTSAQVLGPVVSCVYEECPQAQVATIALEFGTLPYGDFINALRADQWLKNHPDAPAEQIASIRQFMVDAFYVDADDWRGMVAAQARVAVVQACMGLAQG